MINVRESDIVSNLLENLIIYNDNNDIIYTGVIISSELGEIYSDLAKLKVRVNGELISLYDEISRVRETSRWVLITIDGIDKDFILFKSSMTDSSNVILSDKNRVFKISQIKYELNERVKELECLYNVSHEIAVSNTLAEAIELCAGHIMRGFQYPEVTSVAIKFRGNSYGESTLKPGPVKNSLTRYFIRNKKAIGEITVSYHDDVEFLVEENKLLNELTSIILNEDERLEKTKALEIRKKILQSKNKALLKLTHECHNSQEKLRTFFRAIADIIIVIDSEYNIIMSNKEDVRKGHKCYEELFGNSIKCENCPAVKTFIEGSTETVEVKYDSKSLSLQAYPILNGNKSVNRVLEVCRDVSVEKELEFQLIQSSKLASLGKLVAGVAHEINNPNTFILGNLRIIKEAFNDIIPLLDSIPKTDDFRIARLRYSMFRENILTLIDDMENGAVRMKKIVEDLRNYAKKDEGDMSDVVEINDVIEHTIRLVGNQVKRQALIEFRPGEKIPDFAGNMQKLEQVFINLILNASQAIEADKGIIIISTEYSPDNNEIIVRVRDNGKGMDEKTRKNVFDPFFTTKRNSGGTGLGLSISYGIIEAHKGRIDIISNLNEGTEFIIFLPVG